MTHLEAERANLSSHQDAPTGGDRPQAGQPTLTRRARRLLKAFRDDPTPGRVRRFRQLEDVIGWKNSALDGPSSEAVARLKTLGLIEERNLGFALTPRGADHILESQPHKNLYVIRLEDVVSDQRRFKDQNPDYDGKKPCMYVGSTGLSPRERFRQHREGYKSSRAVREFGRYIMWGKFRHLNPVPSHEAETREAGLANDLRAKGYGVWQG